MHNHGSKNLRPDQAPPEASGWADDLFSAPERIAQENAEFTEALGIIVSAFVDLGFGASAAHYATRVANDNRRLIAIAEEFQRKAA
ncbi:hypothetical protein [Actibacterium sp. MT2.3-13A]|uniref:hypothetical protein n=1 Tax=Actibacterium sp. MT2.3-13A TaxID=2828332 RepID=UPI001BABB3F2|nr:hypothetical protein [Actibacterium sp. MT2.3-13A]